MMNYIYHDKSNVERPDYLISVQQTSTEIAYVYSYRCIRRGYLAVYCEKVVVESGGHMMGILKT